MAAYGREGDRFRFYEINPLVAQVAAGRLVHGDDHLRFTYLGASPADCRIVLGDARLKLEQELQADPAGQQFDFLVLDAFSGDAVPVHLLTVEAFEVYLRHLQPDGVIAIHISSNHFDLRPICYHLALSRGFTASFLNNRHRDFQGDTGFDCDLSLISSWVILYREQTFRAKFQEFCQPLLDSGEIAGEVGTLAAARQIRPWTDSFSNLLQVLDIK